MSSLSAVSKDVVPGPLPADMVGLSDDGDFDAVARLKEIARLPLPEVPSPDGVRVLHISLYCYKSFAVRIFHALALKDGANSHAMFFKNNFTNDHLPVTETEIQLLKARIATVRPEIVTLSVMAPYVTAAERIVREIRSISDATIIIGGKYPTIDPVHALRIADYACKGEGELVLLHVLDRHRRGRDFRGIKGLWYKDDAGRAVDMGQQFLHQELDDFPYPAIAELQMSFIEMNRIAEADPEIDEDEFLMMAGRGCVYLCSFCVNSLLIPMNRGNGRFVRLRSPENVIEEIEYRRRKCKKAERITFNDEVFGVFDDWVTDFSSKYKAACNMPFECELVPRLIKEHNVEQLAKAGMNSLHFGIQSGQDEIRKEIMHRPGSNSELIEKAQILEDNGVTPQFDIILGNPFDTAESLGEALDLLLALPQPMRLNTYKMQFYPHYPFTKMALEAGHITADDVSYEKCAEGTLYNMVFRPQFSFFNRRVHLENAIYAMPLQNSVVHRMVVALRRHDSILLGALISLIAVYRYNTGFEQRPALIWMRRVVIGMTLLVRGDWKLLAKKTARALVRPIQRRPHTGRLSSR